MNVLLISTNYDLEGHQIGFSKQLVETDDLCLWTSFIRLQFEAQPILFSSFLKKKIKSYFLDMVSSRQPLVGSPSSFLSYMDDTNNI